MLLKKLTQKRACVQHTKFRTAIFIFLHLCGDLYNHSEQEEIVPLSCLGIRSNKYVADRALSLRECVVHICIGHSLSLQERVVYACIGQNFVVTRVRNQRMYRIEFCRYESA